MNDENERSVASDGSVASEPVAWAVYWNECDSPLLHDELPSLDGMNPRPRVVPLYAAPHVDRVVRLPRLSIWERDAVFEALDAAGVRWEVER